MEPAQTDIGKDLGLQSREGVEGFRLECRETMAPARWMVRAFTEASPRAAPGAWADDRGHPLKLIRENWPRKTWPGVFSGGDQ